MDIFVDLKFVLKWGRKGDGIKDLLSLIMVKKVNDDIVNVVFMVRYCGIFRVFVCCGYYGR